MWCPRDDLRTFNLCKLELCVPSLNSTLQFGASYFWSTQPCENCSSRVLGTYRGLFVKCNAQRDQRCINTISLPSMLTFGSLSCTEGYICILSKYEYNVMSELSNITFLFNPQAHYISRVTALEFLLLSLHCQHGITFPTERLSYWLTKAWL